MSNINNVPIATLKELHQYWLSKKGDRQMPARSDIQPREIAHLLADIVLVDVEHDPMRFRARLVGTNTVNAMGVDLTGQYVDQYVEKSGALPNFLWLVEEKRPYYVEGDISWLNKRYKKFCVAGFPLSDDGERVNMILYGACFYYDGRKP